MNTTGTILITGGTGLIGKALTKALIDKGYTVIILTRNPEKQTVSDSAISYARWDVAENEIDGQAVAKADYIIHLAGANVAEKRWTKKRKQEIVDSRIKSAALLIKGLKENTNNVQGVISASAIGWYGPDSNNQSGSFKETDPVYDDFLGQTCKQWEESIESVKQLNKRLVLLRTGIVLSNEGGALVEFKKPLNFGIAAILGSGKQVISWIHIDDLVRMYCYAIENENVQGVYNAVAPEPVTNKKLVLELAAGRPFFIPVHVPSFVLKIVLGEMSIEVLKSATVSCKKIQSERFTFLYPSIKAAVKELSVPKS